MDICKWADISVDCLLLVAALRSSSRSTAIRPLSRDGNQLPHSPSEYVMSSPREHKSPRERASPKSSQSSEAAEQRPDNEPHPTNTQIPFVSFRPPPWPMGDSALMNSPSMTRTRTMSTPPSRTMEGESWKCPQGVARPERVAASSRRPSPCRRASLTTATSTGGRFRARGRPNTGAPTTTGRTTAWTLRTTSSPCSRTTDCSWRR